MRVPLILALLLACAAPGAAVADVPLRSPLADHPSPYLAMHADDPVRWRLWDTEAFERAAREGRLLLVSTGYFGCHWCHVMQRESYRDPAIAASINRHFIPVKLDREWSPAVDAVLMDFLRRTRGRAGWPANVFLTPDGFPLAGTLYLPPREFQAFLEDLADRWARQAGVLADMARAAAHARGERTADAELAPSDRPLDERFLEAALARADELAGGFGAQSKFPMAPQLAALLDLQARGPDPRLAEFLRLTLEQMAAQGLRDHIGGGFFRYTTDPGWQLPHFEKMLYDNAQLVVVYLHAAERLGEPRFADVAADTLEFLLRDMAAPGGGYVAALSAVDAAGAEGGYYLWDAAAVARLAGEHFPLLRRFWGLDGAPAFAGGHHLVPHTDRAALARAAGRPAAEIERILEDVRLRMRAARTARGLPVDGTVLAGWNGLMLTALSEAARVFDAGHRDGRYVRAARAQRDFIVAHFLADGQLMRVRPPGRAPAPAELEDYALVAAGLHAYGTVFGADAADGGRIRDLLARAWARFHDEDAGWRLGEDALLRWGTGGRAVPDGPLPAPPAVLMGVLRQLDPAAVPAAAGVERALAQALPAVRRAPFAHASHVALYRRDARAASQSLQARTGVP